jgi:hypothetical protein
VRREAMGMRLTIAEKKDWIDRIAHPRSTGRRYNYSYILGTPETKALKGES